MKNNKLLLKIYLSLLIIFIITLIILAVLGNKTRIGYLTEFTFDEYHINRTLELNGLNIDETKKLFISNNQLNNEALINYIFTNEAVTNYSYGFRIKYYSKVFRNSDIYGVYPNIDKILSENNFVKKIKMDTGGSPYGNLISDKKINYTDQIENINYSLSIKGSFIKYLILGFIFICLLILAFIILSKFEICKYILKYRYVLTLIFIISIILLSLSVLGSIQRSGYLSNFNFNIDRTLELNGLNIDETKKLFISNNQLNNEALTNYISTNETITNYSYSFSLEYYSKIFRSSDIYDVYIDIDKLIKINDFIKEIRLDDKGSRFGNLVCNKKLDSIIDNVTYTLKLKEYFIILITFIPSIVIILYMLSYLYIKYFKYKKDLSYKDYKFVSILEFTAIFLFIFQLFVCYPGYFLHYDTVRTMHESFYGHSHWDPVFMQLIFIFLKLFDYNMGLLLFIDLLLFYIGLYFIILSLYFKFKNRLVILLYLISFISNIYFPNIYYIKDTVATIYVCFSYSFIFMLILLNPQEKKIRSYIKILSLIFLIIGMLHRHNFIVTVYPIFVYFTYDILKNKNYKNKIIYLVHFINFMFIFAFMLLMVFYSQRLIKETNPIWTIKYAPNGSYILIISAIATISNDESLIPQNWYVERGNFEYVKYLYNYNPYFADQFYTYVHSPFKEPILDGYRKTSDYKKVLIKSILKHPIAYIRHLLNYSWKMYNMGINDAMLEQLKLDINFLKMNDIHNDFKLPKILNSYYKDYNFYRVTPLQERLYNFFIKVLPDFKPAPFVIISVIIFFISIFIFVFRNYIVNSILVFAFSTSFSAFATAGIVVLFSPVVNYRYIHPVIPITIISIIAFIAFIFNIGGIKIFIKELRGNNK
ncbi:hypothetical protein R4K89_14535 [Brachyspira intermedia]|uniref:hypothetical protein n=1 Tax=Brachyspira intermedia TaxID=84377 RepID=UPI00300555EA